MLHSSSALLVTLSLTALGCATSNTDGVVAQEPRQHLGRAVENREDGAASSRFAAEPSNRSAYARDSVDRNASARSVDPNARAMRQNRVEGPATLTPIWKSLAHPSRLRMD